MPDDLRAPYPVGPGAVGQMMDQTHAAAGSMAHAELVELSVVLVATSNNPSIINPDFLCHNGIIDKDRRLQEDPVATPVFAQVVYEGGLTVRADPERVMFVQSASEEKLTGIVCPTMAEGYVRAVPHVPYRALGINPKLHVALDKVSRARVVNALDGRGSWLSFKDSEPEVQLKAIYRFSGRRITMDVLGAARRRPSGGESRGLLFQGNVHRELEQTSSQTRVDTLVSIIGEWETDVRDCRALSDKFTQHAARDLT